MGHNAGRREERNLKWLVSYSNISISDAQKRLGFRVEKLKAISVAKMLADANYEPGGVGLSKTKEKVYGDIVQYLDTEGYPMVGIPEFNDANASDLVYTITSPILEFQTQEGAGCMFAEGERDLFCGR